jgi:hypothetical protein
MIKSMVWPNLNWKLQDKAKNALAYFAPTPVTKKEV